MICVTLESLFETANAYWHHLEKGIIMPAPAPVVVVRSLGYRQCAWIQPDAEPLWQKLIPPATNIAGAHHPDMLRLPAESDNTSLQVAETVEAIMRNRQSLLDGETMDVPWLKDNPDGSTVMKAFANQGWQVTETNGTPQIAVVPSLELCAAR